MPTIFYEELAAHLHEGMSFYQAKQRAVDYYKKFTRWEEHIESYANSSPIQFIAACKSPNAEIVAQSSWLDANLSADEIIGFRELFDLLLDYCDSLPPGDTQQIGKKWLACIVREANLEHILSEARQQWVARVLAGTQSTTIREIAHSRGYADGKKSRTHKTFDTRLSAFRDALRSHSNEYSL
jgi:hypothetical protein